MNNYVITERWDSYQKESDPNNIIHNIHDVSIELFNGFIIPDGVFDLPFRNYYIEWIITRDDRLLFTDISVLSK